MKWEGNFNILKYINNNIVNINSELMSVFKTKHF